MGCMDVSADILAILWNIQWIVKTCNKKPVEPYMCTQGRWQFNMQYVRSMTNHQLVSITFTLTKPNTKLKL